MNVIVENGGKAQNYDIHDNHVVYVNKLIGTPMTGMDDDGKTPNPVAEASQQAMERWDSKPKRVGKKPAPVVVDSTYTYKWIKEFPQKIILLYQGLLALKWIDPATRKEDFMALFSGKPARFTIRWNRDSTQLLWYLFKLIKDRNYVTRPEGVSKWAIEKNHFVSKQGRMITDWTSQHEPLRDKETIEQLADLLDPTSDILDKSYRQEDRLLFGRD